MIGNPPHRIRGTRSLVALGVGLAAANFGSAVAAAQFHDPFDGSVPDGWVYFSGAGEATIEFVPAEGYRSIVVDATRDRRNVWWALIRRDVSAALDLSRLAQAGQELRLEARIRTSHAPRRVNLHFNTQRTTDFHFHLMEFDLPDTTGWHTISMTTHGFDARIGDTVHAQLALMDWGLSSYRVDIDYIRVDVVDADSASPDLGEPLPYHPPIPDPRSFGHHLRVAQNAVVDVEYPEVNLDGWYAVDAGGRSEVLSVGGTRRVLLRWDLARYAGRHASGPAVLELTTHSVKRPGTERPDFGLVRVAEILGGDPAWDRRSVTLESLLQARPIEEVFNPQMIIDIRVEEGAGDATRAMIPRPVVQRLLEGRTRGIVLQPLGVIEASFYALEGSSPDRAPRLRFDLSPE